STCRFVRWFNKKYGREIDNREWVKVHLMCGVDTKIVTSVDVSGWAANDTPYFVPLLERTAKYFQIQEVSADKAYLSYDAAKLIFFLQGYERRISNVYGSDRSAVSSGVLYAARPGCDPRSSKQRRNPARQACASTPLGSPVGS